MSDIDKLAQHLHEWDKRHRTRRQRLVLRMKPWMQRPAAVASIAFTSGVLVTALFVWLFPSNEVVIPPLPAPSYTPFTYAPTERPSRPQHPASIYTPPAVGSPATR